MKGYQQGTVTEIVETLDDLVRLKVAIDEESVAAVGFPQALGEVKVDDRLIVNTAGIELDLGTGGDAFVLWNLDGPGPSGSLPGHIVKMRYTPWQLPVLSVEAPESSHHDALAEAESLGGCPVVVCTLHSQVAGAVAGIKASQPTARVGYLMTDGAALPLAWSNLIRDLRKAGLLDVTCTSGHAFGGDLEAVNFYSGLIALREVGGCNAIVVAMGPGVVGTGTALGFTGMEQGAILDAVTTLGGRSFACLRVSFVDKRERHRGISHHSITTLRVAAREPTTAVLPILSESHHLRLSEQWHSSEASSRHSLVFGDGDAGVRLLRAKGLQPRSMGWSMDEAPELFLAAAAAGDLAAEWITDLI